MIGQFSIYSLCGLGAIHFGQGNVHPDPESIYRISYKVKTQGLVGYTGIVAPFFLSGQGSCALTKLI